MLITVKEVGQVETATKGKNTWYSFPVKYKNDRGSELTKKFVSFDPIWSEAKLIEVGKSYEVKIEKDGSNWAWRSIKETEPPKEPASSSGTPRAGGSSWETKEEREKRQINIMRQSSVSYAIEFYKLHPASTPSIEEVFEKANEIFGYVTGDRGSVIQNNTEEIGDVE